jgi:hypothetical protein
MVVMTGHPPVQLGLATNSNPSVGPFIISRFSQWILRCWKEQVRNC